MIMTNYNLFLSDKEENTEEVLKAKELELRGVKSAEGGQIGEALNLFNQAIMLKPTRPSGYNNRAQAYRIIGQDDGIVYGFTMA
jgi:Flp pilus assembly protein TadD